MSGGHWSSSRHVRTAAAALVLVLGLAVLAGLRLSSSPAVSDVAFSELVATIEADQVARVTIDADALEFERRDGSVSRTLAPPGYTAANPAFVPGLVARGVRIDVARPGGASWTWLLALVVAVPPLGFLLYRRVVNGRVLGGLAGAAPARRSTVTFADVAGADEATSEVREIVECLKDPERYAAVGGRVPRGILLAGPPGTGKTLLARSMAGEAGVPFLSASGSDFVEMFAGVGAARVRKLFKAARRQAPCIVFIDELDAIGRRRGTATVSHEEREHTLNQLLVEMDGFSPSHNVIVVAATNRADVLDPALLRPGRFDRQVTVDTPDLLGREQILRVHARRVVLADDVDIRHVARGTPGFSGADLSNLVNEAALQAARHGRGRVAAADLDAARDKMLMGVERRSLVMTQEERVTCAYHEAGHAVVAALLPHADPLHKVTIVPRNRALGVTVQLPETDRHTYSKPYLEARIAVLMGGRAAETLFLDQRTSGAANDIERATDLARAMVCDLGMSPLGPLCFRPGGAQAGDAGAGFSEATAQRVDAEMAALVQQGDDTARSLLEAHRDAVRLLALDLLEEESVDGARVLALLGLPTARSA